MVLCIVEHAFLDALSDISQSLMIIKSTIFKEFIPAVVGKSISEL